MKLNFEKFTINLAVFMVLGLIMYGVIRDNQRATGKSDFLEVKVPNVTVLHKNTEVAP